MAPEGYLDFMIVCHYGSHLLILQADYSTAVPDGIVIIPRHNQY